MQSNEYHCNTIVQNDFIMANVTLASPTWHYRKQHNSISGDLINHHSREPLEDLLNPGERMILQEF